MIWAETSGTEVLGLPSAVSAELQSYLEGSVDSLHANHDAVAALNGAPEVICGSVPFVFACSDFVAQSCARDPTLLRDLLERYDLRKSFTIAEVVALAPTPAAEPPAESQMLEELRRWRRRALVRIAWRDLMGWAGLEETLLELSAFADAAIDAAARYARQLLVVRYGEPRSAEGVAQPLVVVAMGKLGGRELNFSSDVDLVMLFPEYGETDGARPISNEEFFVRLGQTLIRLLDAPTHDGFVLRVDMRLRPFGDSGPLVSSFAAFEDYLPRHGRDWERYAYVKARAVTASEAYQALYSAAVRAFTYA